MLIFSFALATLFASSVVQSHPTLSPFRHHRRDDHQCARTYTVKVGDYCNSISASQGVSTSQLRAANAAAIDATCSNLVEGQVLCLGFVGQDCTQTYVVKDGDICDLISSTFKISNDVLYANNPDIDSNCFNIYKGQVLCVAPTVFKAATLPAPLPAAVPPPAKHVDSPDSPDTPDTPDTPDLPGTDEDDELPEDENKGEDECEDDE